MQCSKCDAYYSGPITQTTLGTPTVVIHGAVAGSGGHETPLSHSWPRKCLPSCPVTRCLHRVSGSGYIQVPATFRLRLSVWSRSPTAYAALSTPTQVLTSTPSTDHHRTLLQGHALSQRRYTMSAGAGTPTGGVSHAVPTGRRPSITVDGTANLLMDNSGDGIEHASPLPEHRVEGRGIIFDATHAPTSEAISYYTSLTAMDSGTMLAGWQIGASHARGRLSSLEANRNGQRTE